MDHLRVAVILERRKGSVHPRLIPEFYETSLDVVLSSLGVRLSFLTFLISGYPLNVYGGQQFFRHKPKDLKIQEGGEAVLECEISMLQGEVQWTKNGFALVPLQNCVPEPRSPQIKPGFPVQLPEDTLKTPAPV
ncbi:hypothetical protein RUM43_009416 [Polyplax serrata]|uniref:Uncharacterized protein n=1 Tax=Polyplax serrata TaxID=468196 RepID=A0AAN8PWD0_POLSC